MADQKDFFVEGAAELLRSLGDSSIETVRKIILKTATQNSKDDAVLQWLKIIGETGPQPTFQDWITSLFWDLPHDSKGFASFPKSKEWILRKVIEDWKPERFPETSIRAFLFLLAVYEPTKDHLKACQAPEFIQKTYENSWDSQCWTYQTRRTILELIRDYTGPQFTPKAIEEWLTFPYIPIDIAEVILHAWVRNGGWDRYQAMVRASTEGKRG